MKLFVILDNSGDNYVQEDEFNEILMLTKDMHRDTKDENEEKYNISDRLRQQFDALKKDAIDFTDF
jgi:hypothetical protein